MYRVLCARESLREKRMEEGERYEFVSCGVKRHLRFSQKKSFWWILVKRAIYFSLSLLVFLFFCSSSLRAWCVSLRRGAFLKYDLTIVLLHFILFVVAAAHRVSSLFSPIHPVLLLLIMLVVVLHSSSAFSDFFLAAAAP